MEIFQLLEQQPGLFYTLIFILGLLIGSFLNVVIYRYPIMLKRQWKTECTEYLSQQDELSSLKQEPEKEQIDKEQDLQQTARFDLIYPHSRCPNCQHKITALENIPIISWLFLKGKCSNCKTSISTRYPLVEFLTACLSLLVAYKFGYGYTTLCLLGFTWSLICLSLIDFDTQFLPDDITLPLLWAGLLVSLLNLSSVSITDSIIGVMAGYVSLWSVYKLFKLFPGKEGMGYGDFKLLAALGAWLGWQMLPIVIFLSAFVGAIVGISMMLFLGRDKNIPIPFGPYLATAGFLALTFGPEINNYYLSVIGMS
jgi:leader peptidase (prepilin peptidase)/N-methyltransferase